MEAGMSHSRCHPDIALILNGHSKVLNSFNTLKDA